jgi:hypothetical protein
MSINVPTASVGMVWAPFNIAGVTGNAPETLYLVWSGSPVVTVPPIAMVWQ